MQCRYEVPGHILLFFLYFRNWKGPQREPVDGGERSEPGTWGKGRGKVNFSELYTEMCCVFEMQIVCIAWNNYMQRTY